jgi:hypothetical protein
MVILPAIPDTLLSGVFMEVRKTGIWGVTPKEVQLIEFASHQLSVVFCGNCGRVASIALLWLSSVMKYALMIPLRLSIAEVPAEAAPECAQQKW